MFQISHAKIAIVYWCNLSVTRNSILDYLSHELYKDQNESNTFSKLTLFRMALFRGCSNSSLKSVTHILQWWNLAVLPHLIEDDKIYESRDTRPEFCWHHRCFIENQQILLYQKIQIQILFWHIFSNIIFFKIE